MLLRSSCNLGLYLRKQRNASQYSEHTQYSEKQPLDYFLLANEPFLVWFIFFGSMHIWYLVPTVHLKLLHCEVSSCQLITQALPPANWKERGSSSEAYTFLTPGSLVGQLACRCDSAYLRGTALAELSSSHTGCHFQCSACATCLNWLVHPLPFYFIALRPQQAPSHQPPTAFQLKNKERKEGRKQPALKCSNSM